MPTLGPARAESCQACRAEIRLGFSPALTLTPAARTWAKMKWMRPKVYLETTIISYLTARASQDLVVAAHQKLTTEWWIGHRSQFDLFASGLVLKEAGDGDPQAAARRLAELSMISVLGLNEQVRELAKRFLESKVMPEKAVEDALHIAIATVHGMDYLLTWNCRHIANAQIVRRLSEICEDLGYELPTVCTPEQLMGD